MYADSINLLNLATYNLTTWTLESQISKSYYYYKRVMFNNSETMLRQCFVDMTNAMTDKSMGVKNVLHIFFPKFIIHGNVYQKV